MGRQFEIVIGDEVYTGSTAPAKDQLEMAHIAAKTNIIAALKDGTDNQTLIASLMFADQHYTTSLKNLCFKNGKITREKDSVPVAENLFQDDIFNFYLLLGLALKENIGNFWQLSRREDLPE